MRFYILIGLVLALSACAAPPATPMPGPPLAVSTPRAPIAPEAGQSRIGGVVMTAVEAGAVPGAISRPLSTALAFVCWLAPMKGDAGSPGTGSGTMPPGRALTERDLAGFGVDRETALELASANLRAGLRAGAAVLHPPAGSGIAIDAGDFGEAGRLALGDEWADLAAAMGGRLLVAAPAADTLLYADGEASGAVAALQARARAVMAQSARPISSAVLRWADGSWVLAAAAAGGGA